MTTTILFGAAEAQTARDLIGGTAIGDNRNDLLKQLLVATANRTGGSGGAAWGSITGTLADQADLVAALALKLDKAGGIITGNGAASTPALTLNGTVFTGGSATTTKPLFLLEPSGTTSNAWSTGGTMLGVNAASGFAGDVFNFQVASVDRFRINSDGVFAFNKIGASGDVGSITSIYGTISVRTDGNSAFLVNKNLGALEGGHILAFSDSGQFRLGISQDVIFARKAAATIQLGVDAAGVTNQMFTAASRITSDGVGANLTIAGGNGRGGAGGSLIFSTYDTEAAGTPGNLRTRMFLDTDGALTIPGGLLVVLDETYGVTWASTTTQLQGWWGATPTAQPTFIADATGGVVEDAEARAALNDLLAKLRTIGLISPV